MTTAPAPGARVVAVLVGRDTASLVTSPVDRVRVTLEGFEGDRHAGFTRRATAREPHYPRGTELRNNRQVTLVSEDELAAVAMELGLRAIDPAWIGANLVVAGIGPLPQLPRGTRLIFPDDAVLAVEGENRPCRHAGAAVAAATGRPDTERLFVRVAVGRRGLIASVERAGTIAAGDPMRVALPAGRLDERVTR